MSYTVIGTFDQSADAQRAQQQLAAQGIDPSQIDISREVSDGQTDSTDSSWSGGKPSSASESGSDSGSDSGIGGFFSSLFNWDDETSDQNRRAQRTNAYRYAAESAGALVTVHARSQEEAHLAAQILDECGADDIDERAVEFYASGMGQTGQASSDMPDEATLQVLREELQVGKRTVEAGGVRLRSKIIERPVEEQVRLRHEYVRVQRVPVNRPATEADFGTFQQGELELREQREVPVVNKEARVVEEIHVGREAEEHVETIRDTVRETDVEVENLSESGHNYHGNAHGADRSGSAGGNGL